MCMILNIMINYHVYIIYCYKIELKRVQIYIQLLNQNQKIINNYHYNNNNNNNANNNEFDSSDTSSDRNHEMRRMANQNSCLDFEINELKMQIIIRYNNLYDLCGFVWFCIDINELQLDNNNSSNNYNINSNKYYSFIFANNYAIKCNG